jgi:hypothetical protein
MWLMRANFEELGLGEGYTVDAYSESLDRLKAWTWQDALRQGCKEDQLRWQWNEECNVWVLQNIWSSTADYADDDEWDTWVILEDGNENSIRTPVNVDAL